MRVLSSCVSVVGGGTEGPSVGANKFDLGYARGMSTKWVCVVVHTSWFVTGGVIEQVYGPLHPDEGDLVRDTLLASGVVRDITVVPLLDPQPMLHEVRGD